MAFQFTTNKTPASGAAALIELKNLLKLAGWTILKYGEGTGGAVVNVVDQNADDLLDATKLDTASAWFLMQQPAGGAAPYSGTRQLLFWRSATTTKDWYIGYSRSAGFTGGTVDATTPPTATDEQGLVTTSRSTTRIFPDHAFRAQYGAFKLEGETADISPFVFWMVCYKSGSSGQDNVVNMALLFEGMAKGSFPFDPANPTDPTKSELDPYVFYCKHSPTFSVNEGGFLNYSNLSGSWDTSRGGGKTWNELGTAEAAWNEAGAAYKSFASGTIPNSAGYNHVTGKIDLIPIEWGSSVAYKGVGNTFRWPTVNMLNADLTSVNSTGDRICFDDLVFPWPGVATTPLT